MGFPVTAFVAVRFACQDEVGHAPRMHDLAAHPSVLECHHVAGEDCYILKVATASLERLEGLLRDLHGPSGTTSVNTRTTIVLSTLFEKPGIVPAEPD
jgi:Lrp/AsnC family leucine-responsive transcriptional regulator